MKKALPEMEHTTWLVSDLRPHPRQADYFRTLPGAMIRALAADIDRNKLREPVEVLPDGTIISGHQRVRAVRELEWEEVAVVVRHDLAALGDEAIEHRLIEANVNRRHLSTMEVARSFKRLKELAAPVGSRNGKGDLRDQVAKMFGKSGRTLARLVPLLDLPREVQEAVDDKRIPVKTASQLAKLPAEAHETVAAAIREGKNLGRAVLLVRHAAGLVGRTQATSEQLKAQLRLLLRQGKRLVDEKKRLRQLVRPDQVPLLRALSEFVSELCPASKEQVANEKEVGSRQVKKGKAPH